MYVVYNLLISWFNEPSTNEKSIKYIIDLFSIIMNINYFLERWIITHVLVYKDEINVNKLPLAKLFVKSENAFSAGKKINWCDSYVYMF